ncbi:DNA primase large subunit PriL [Halorussus halophilus]|uniref:DNA primase large subunit PriL n=1 Tax=Halorussus halophilus TaxID=2650975 RepID=UPI001300D4F3|nr:DNA primase large subunit PriL [Halorussus halophilus]
MDPLHARYPFLAAARESVRSADIGLAEIVVSEGDRHPAVERGRQRVRRALIDGTVRPPEDAERRWGTSAELLSYPVARVLVSLLDAPGAVEKYASAEADTAYERFTSDLENPDDGLKSTTTSAITLDDLLAEFDLASAVEQRGENYRMAVGDYLALSSGLSADEWRLPVRQLADGTVVLKEAELHELLREATRRRIAEGLPLAQVPDPIREGLTGVIEELEDTFSEVELARDIDTLAPGQFPPCMSALLERARDGENLENHSEFALVTFLASIGADAEDIAALCGTEGLGQRALQYRVDRIADEKGSQFAPPTCATMAAYEECPVADEDDPTTDERCAEITHPLVYYEEALAEADGVTDWREA